MIEESGSPEPLEVGRVTQLMLVVVFAAALVGFLVGIDIGGERESLPVRGETAVATGAGVSAMSYAEMRVEDVGPNSAWRSNFDRLARADADVLTEQAVDPVAKISALLARADRRAFGGAPPVIPHRVDSASNANCVSCHAESVRIGNATSPLMPHEFLANCQQCHAQGDSRLLESYLAPVNTFVGRAEPAGGDRAWDGAPPVVSHSTFMRTNCMSCHGPTGDVGIRTPHAYQASCLQCHAPSAELDQHSFSAPVEFIGIGDGGSE